jgi:hypothetical protein
MELIKHHQKIIVIVALLLAFNGFAQNSYTPNIASRTEIRKAIWQELKEKTPKKNRFMTGLVFNSNGCFDIYEKAARKYDWKPYELYTVAAFYKIVLEEVVSGRTYTEKEVEDIYSKTKSNYTLYKIDYKYDNKTKQQKYDALIVKALWIGTINELAKKKNPEIKKMASNMLATLETDDSEITIVEERNIPKKTAPKPIPRQESEIASVSKEKVSDVILRTSTKYGLGGVYIANDVSVLYTNGDIYTNPSKPINKINITASKRQEPKKWRTWKKRGNVLYITDPRKKKTYDWKKWFKVRSGSKDFKLSGKFNTSDSFGGASVINASTVVFDKQGKFAWKTIKGGNTVWKPVFSKSNSSGTYQIDGLTITLRYNNGVEEQFFFGLYPKDNEHFVIGSSHFVPVKK